MDAEFNLWKSRHPFVLYEYDNGGRKRDFDMYRANIGPHEVTVLLTGMGSVSATRAMQIVPPELHDAWISTGLAGALDSELALSATVVARTVMTRDETLQVLSDVDFVNDVIRVRESKTRAGERTIPMSGRCKIELLGWRSLLG